jgi:WhiB family redox-sensing transcriptional regulator
MTATRTTVKGKAVPKTPWTAQATCRGYEPSLWFPTGGSTWEERKAFRFAVDICKSCPVRDECLKYSLHYEREGIWGGRTQREREALRRQLRIDLVRVPSRAHL